MFPKPRSSPIPDDSPTPNIAEYIKSIPSWSPEEQMILEENMKHYPVSQNAEFKRLTLLMTNLPNKRLRDVSLRVKYLKAKETQDISWENFLQNSFGQQKVELSPSHSIKSPRATPIEKEEKQKRPKRQNTRVKKEEEDLSMSRESNNQLSINSASYRDREMPMTSQQQSMMNQMPYQQMSMGQNRMSMGTPIMSSQLSHQQYNRNMMMPSPQHYQGMLRQPVFYPPREKMMSIEEQTCDSLIQENERCIEIITSAIFNKSGDITESVNCFHANITKLLQLTTQMAPTPLPMFIHQPAHLNIPGVHKFKKIEMPPEHMRQQQPTYREFQMGNNAAPSQRDDGRRNDLL